MKRTAGFRFVRIFFGVAMLLCSASLAWAGLVWENVTSQVSRGQSPKILPQTVLAPSKSEILATFLTGSNLFRRLCKMFTGKACKSARNEAYLSYAAMTKDAVLAQHADFLRSRYFSLDREATFIYRLIRNAVSYNMHS